jgi:putative transposase
VSEGRRGLAEQRLALLRPHLSLGVPLTRVAADSGVPIRTMRRWLAAYRAGGPAGLARAARSDRGTRRLPVELVHAIEGMALRRPPPRTAHVHRQAARLAADHGWPAPSYATVRSIVAALDPGLRTLAHAGPAAYRDRYELVYRREADRPNAIWQADHTQLDLLVLDPAGRPARPWLTAVLDDYSRAVAGYTVFLGAPTAAQTALALRQAVWRKADPAWPVLGLPDVLYSDHGADFTSTHLEQVCADTHVQLVHSTPGVPQGRGKVERLFGTVTSELLPTLPGHLPHGSHGTPVTAPALTLAALDAAVGRFVVHDYHARPHSETGQPPAHRWAAGGWLPRMPESLEQLDLLLLTVARPRIVHRDGIHLHGLRYLDLTLADFVGEPVTIRYDPRDLAEIRVFHAERFLCRAVAPDLAAQTISLRDLQAARTARRRQLRAQLTDRLRLADQLLPPPAAEPAAPAGPDPAGPSTPPKDTSRLRRYRED